MAMQSYFPSQGVSSYDPFFGSRALATRDPFWSDRPLSAWQDTPASNLNRIMRKQQREMRKFNPILNIDIYERVSTAKHSFDLAFLSFLVLTFLSSFIYAADSSFIYAADFHSNPPLGQRLPALRRLDFFPRHSFPIFPDFNSFSSNPLHFPPCCRLAWCGRQRFGHHGGQ